ncbi:MAG: hypothetical protein IH867_09425 [Chloroflexi bacterium]|nr:hypothetical protein [Chloroflexota bacterium]
MLDPEQSTVVTDEEVPSRIRSVIESAEVEVVLVSPYVDNWQRLFDWLPTAVKKGVKVLLLTRRDDSFDGKTNFGGSSGTDILARLAREGVEVRWLEKLHSKIYANEKEVVVTSMNLLASSAANSKEIGLSLTSGANVIAVRKYLDQLRALSKPFTAPGAKKSKPSTEKKPAKRDAKLSTGSGKKRQPKVQTQGHCIRCGTGIAFSTDRPLCDKDYGIWAQYEDPEYPEDYCHSCGKEKDTSYAKPLCTTCFKKNATATGAPKRPVPTWFRNKTSR